MNKLTKNILYLGSLSALAILYSCNSTDSPSPEPSPSPSPSPSPGDITENSIEWCDNINDPTTWSNHTDGVDYIVTCEVAVRDGLTIEPGTEIVFENNNTGFLVGSGGVLIAKGTSAKPIYFRGKNGLAGEWKGIKLT